jgi:hypothetical protein
MNEFEKFPKLTEYIEEMANTGKAPKQWTGFITELNQALQLLQTDVSNNEVAVAFVKWLTEKDSKYAILYGGTPDLKKDYRLATLEDDYTIEEVFEEFKKATDY